MEVMEVMDIYQEDITNDYQQFFEDDYNVIIYAGEEPNIKELHAHSIILRCRSEYFRTAFNPNWAERKNGMYILKKPNISGNVFQVILSYIYSGMINFSQIERTDYLELLNAADELAFDRIVESLQEYLINYQKDYLKKDLIGILQAFSHKQFIPLRDFCIDTICQEILSGSERSLKLQPHILELLFQQDKLALDEIDIWNFLIKWAHAQNPTIKSDPSKWSSVDVRVMKRTVNDLIPLIRFQNISSEDYLEKISPYKKLLQRKVNSQFYSGSKLKTSKPLKLDSTIITSQKDLYHSLFSNWINKRDIVSKARKFYQCEFKLVLRGSRDGFDGNSFHNKCDDKGATITIAKIKNSNQLVGGFNPLDWREEEGNCSKDTSDSFIFLFDDYKNVDSGKISRVINTKRAVRCIDNWGPIFGEYNTITKSNDLTMNPNGKWISIPSSYPDLNIPIMFEIDDYEVFQVVN